MKETTEAKTAMTREERDFITRFTAAHCRPHAEVVAGLRRAEMRLKAEMLFAAKPAEREAFPLAAGSASAAAPREAVKSPGEEVRFLFSAEAEDGETPAWRTEVTVPPCAVAETPVTARTRRANGAPVESGVLRLAGRALRVADGVSTLSFGDFLSGMDDTDVSLAEPGGSPVKGALTFF